MCHDGGELQIKRVVFVRRAIGVVAIAVLWVGPAQAQTSSRGEPVFSPSVSLLGSLGTNAERVPGASRRNEFYTATVQLPFQFRSRRWNFDVVYQPTYEYYREDDALTTLDHSGSFALSGVLSRRTRLAIEGDAYVSNELRGLDATDILLPRTRQLRGEMDAVLEQQLSTRGTLSFNGRFQRLRFPNGDRVDSDSTDFSVGYGHALSARVTATLSAGGAVASFDNGGRSRSTSVSAGGTFQIARNTTIEVEGGLLLIEQDLGAGWVAADQPGFAVLASLDHTIDRVGLQLQAQRDMGTTSGFGQATLRDRVVGSIAWGSNRWDLVALAGYARNASLAATDGPRPSVKTVSGCGRVAVRVSRVLAMVGTALYAHQLGEFLGAQPVTDTFRISLGIRLQANGVPLNSSSRQFRFDSIARSARATC